MHYFDKFYAQEEIDNRTIIGYGGITQNDYDKKALSLKQRQYELNELLNRHTQADEKFSLTLISLMELASRAYELFISSKVEQKRQLLGFVLSNLTLNGRKLCYELKRPFNVFNSIGNCLIWLPGADSNHGPAG